MKPNKDFVKELCAMISIEQEVISTGSLENMRDYGKACGRVEGMRTSLRIFQDLWDDYRNKTAKNEIIEGDIDFEDY